jgi:hypothetical protein
MLVDGKSMEDCLKDHPDYRDELRPLLDVAVNTRRAVASIEARPEFKARLRYELNSAFNTSTAPRRSIFKWQAQWATAAVSFCLVLILSGGGVVAAASNSMPDDTLYGVKRATEQVQLFFTFSEQGKAELYAELVDKRVNEIINMAAENNAEAVKKTNSIMRDQLSMLAGTEVWSPPENSSQTAGGTLTDITIASTATCTCTKAFDNGEGDFSLSPEATSSPGGINSDLMQTLMYSSSNNLEAINNAMGNASGDVLQALMETLKILNNGYNTAINNIS